MGETRLCLGAITGAHGVRGDVRIKTFTATPEAIGDYGPLQDEAGAEKFEISRLRAVRYGVVAAIKGITDRGAAEALKGTRLYISRAALPQPEREEYYHADLIGITAIYTNGAPAGAVKAVHDFGAGDVLEIENGKTLFVPFTCEAVPRIDLDEGVLTVAPPDFLDE